MSIATKDGMIAGVERTGRGFDIGAKITYDGWEGQADA
jgi:hypothetical protein